MTHCSEEDSIQKQIETAQTIEKIRTGQAKIVEEEQSSEPLAHAEQKNEDNEKEIEVVENAMPNFIDILTQSQKL